MTEHTTQSVSLCCKDKDFVQIVVPVFSNIRHVDLHMQNAMLRTLD